MRGSRITSSVPLIQSLAVRTARSGSSCVVRISSSSPASMLARLPSLTSSYPCRAKFAGDLQGHFRRCSLRQLSLLWVQPQSNPVPREMDRMPSPALGLARIHACGRQLAYANACQCVLASSCACVIALSVCLLLSQPACVRQFSPSARLPAYFIFELQQAIR